MICLYKKIKKSKVVESTVASCGPFDVGDSARLLGTLPEDLSSDLGGRELTFEVSARSNLEPMVVALTIVALNDFSLDFDNVSLPILKVSWIEDSVIEVDFVGSSKLMGISVREAVILAKGEFLVVLESLNLGIRDLVKIAEIVVEGMSLEVDLAKNVSLNLGDSSRSCG